MCLLADAALLVGQGLELLLREAGAEIIALQHVPRRSRPPQPFRAGVGTFAALVDLTDAREVTDALTWALRRTGRMDLAVPTSGRAGPALAALAARPLELTARFQVERAPLLVYLARPSEQAAHRLERTLAAATVSPARSTWSRSMPARTRPVPPSRPSHR